MGRKLLLPCVWGGRKVSHGEKLPYVYCYSVLLLFLFHVVIQGHAYQNRDTTTY